MHGLTVAPVTLRKKASRLGDICEQQVQEWKKTCENTKQDDTCLVLLKDELLSCDHRWPGNVFCFKLNQL